MTDTWQGSYVYYGKYNGKPMKYRVLSSADSLLYLDCDNVLDSSEFSTGSYHWDDSSVKAWLNGNCFYSNTEVFTDAERSAMHPGNLYNFEMEGVDDSGNHVEGGLVLSTSLSDLPFAYGDPECWTDDNISLLQPIHVTFNTPNLPSTTKAGYGYSRTFEESVTRIKNDLQSGEPSEWWLYPEYSDSSRLSFPAYVTKKGKVVSCNDVNTPRGVSPFFITYIPRIIFSSLLSGEDGQPGAEYKLTLKDNSLGVTPGEVEVDGNTMTVAYSGVSGDPTQLSVVITDSSLNGYGNWISTDAPKYYGKLNVDGSIGTEGTGKCTLPDNDLLKNYNVYLLAEKINEGVSTNYAGVPKSVNVSKKTMQTPKLKESAVTLKTGETFTNELTGAKTTVSYSSSNKDVATVDSSGKVTAVGEGETVITAIAAETDDYFSGKDKYNIKVELKRYTVSFNSNGGSGEMPPDLCKECRAVHKCKCFYPGRL